MYDINLKKNLARIVRNIKKNDETGLDLDFLGKWEEISMDK